MSIELKNITYTYSPDTAYEVHALNGVNLTIGDHEFIGVIGHTGSGKSTLIQHLNGLVHATGGDILYDGESIYQEGYSLRNLRQKVGVVFQYPEHQLFENDVFTDVCFGPKNQGLSDDEIKERAKEALEQVGIKESLYKKSPFELSGGQKRRVAIAGILAMRPKVLILDEPTAGLDPKGRDKILNRLKSLYEQQEITIILVSHSMEDIANYANRLIVMDAGKVRFDDTPKNVFAHYKELEEIGLKAPEIMYLMDELKEEGMDLPNNITTIPEAAEALCKILK